MKDLKILLGYPFFPSNAYQDVEQQALDYINIIKRAGFNIDGFCITVNPPAHALNFIELNDLWQNGNKDLHILYNKLEEKLDNFDVFINGPGINLHPEFIKQLPVFTVFGCNDDPENSHNLSKPAAYAYDLCLIGNIAEIETYHQWGIRNVEWFPMGIYPEFYNSNITYNNILNGERDIDLFMMIDKSSPRRIERLNKIEEAFPNGYFYGKGWKRGYLPIGQERNYLQRAKIGINIHNSTGPINLRTYYLPANGVMQICDNKSNLGKIFELDKEVVGFNTIEECIELCKYYLEHDEERKKIAAAGWKRATEEYTLEATFTRVYNIISECMVEKKKNADATLKCNKKIALRHYNQVKYKWPLYSLKKSTILLSRKIHNKHKLIKNLI